MEHLQINDRLKTIAAKNAFAFTSTTDLVYDEPILVALSQYGEREVPGGILDNPDILQYAKDCGFPDYTHDEISWCGLFMNWVMFKCGMTRTKTLAARDWLKVGKAVPDAPMQGDVVVFWRESIDSWKGHVGIFVREENGLIYVLGGNQNNEVNITGMDKKQLLAYRRMERI